MHVMMVRSLRRAAEGALPRHQAVQLTYAHAAVLRAARFSLSYDALDRMHAFRCC
jgi:hypothetical protein